MESDRHLPWNSPDPAGSSGSVWLVRSLPPGEAAGTKTDGPFGPVESVTNALRRIGKASKIVIGAKRNHPDHGYNEVHLVLSP